MLKVLLFSIMAFAAREHGAHSHGAGKISLAFDGKKGRIEIKAPTESIYGFEHEAKSKADKKKKEDGLLKLEKQISDMIVFNAELKCEIRKDIFEVVQKENHADVEAEFNVTCEKPVAGSTIVFNVQKVFPRFKDADIDALVDSVQKSVEAKQNGTELELK